MDAVALILTAVVLLAGAPSRRGPLNQPEVEFDLLFRADRAACEIGVGGTKQVMPFAGDNHAGQSENG